jgi:hypothetical protein
MREHANISVPSQYKNKAFIFKPFKIVIKGKNDLGRVKDFFHKMHMKDTDPVYRKRFKILDTNPPFLADWLKLGVVQKFDSL